MFVRCTRIAGNSYLVLCLPYIWRADCME